MVNDILWGMEKQRITALTATDLLAALDTTDHEILLEVLQIKFSFTGQAFNLPFSVPEGSCGGLCIIQHMPPHYRNPYG